MYTREELEKLSFEEISELRESVFDRYWFEDGEFMRPKGQKMREYDAEKALLHDLYWKLRPCTELEREFLDVVDDATKRMEEQMEIAKKALDRACAISDETGIPLNASISPLSQTYTPADSKFEELDELLEEKEIYFGEYGGGWEHSAVC